MSQLIYGKRSQKNTDKLSNISKSEAFTMLVKKPFKKNVVSFEVKFLIKFVRFLCTTTINFEGQ